MKKNLLTTTAIVAAGTLAMTTPADAQRAPRGMLGGGTVKLGVGGFMEKMFGFAENDRTAGIGSIGTAPAIAAPGAPTVSDRAIHFDQTSQSEIWFKGWAQLDNGITIIADIQLEANDMQSVAASLIRQIDESYMIVRGKFGQFNLGSHNNAAHLMTTGYLGFWPTTVGESITFEADNWVGHAPGVTGGTSPKEILDIRISGTAMDTEAEKISYFTPRYRGFQLGLSYIPQNPQHADGSLGTGTFHNGYAIGANFTGKFEDGSFGIAGGWMRFQPPEQVVPFAINFGAATNLANRPFAWVIGGRVFYKKWRFGVGYKRQGNIIGAGPRVGPSAQPKLDGATWSVGVRYDFGQYRASVGYVESWREGLSLYHDDDRAQMLQLAVATDLAKGVKLMSNFYYGEFANELATTAPVAPSPLAGQDYDGTNIGWAINAGIRLSF